ncbi:hypothetical protein ACQY1H_18455 [Agrobacterium vitis]|uniref:hypothetical protein n=1 Tax=Agrobacterium vitis TaxID=373 RepID=UPI003D293F15
MFRSGWVKHVETGLIIVFAIMIVIGGLKAGQYYYHNQYAVIQTQSSFKNNVSLNTQRPTADPDVKIYSKKDLEYQVAVLQQQSAEFAFLTILLGGIGSILSFGALWGLFRSLGQTQQAMADTREFGEKQSRAYVSFKVVTITKEDTTSNRRITVEIENSGATPAYDVSCITECIVAEEHSLSFEGLVVSSLPNIAPGDVAKWNRDFDIGTWNHMIFACCRESNFIFIHGKIEYFDIFGRKRWTAFRRKIHKRSDGFVLEGEGFYFCERGNESEITYKKETKH